MIKKIVLSAKELKLELVAFVVGLVILAFELTAARIVAPYLGTTIYVWTSIIGVILAALAVGYKLGGTIADKRDRAEDIIALIAIGAAGILLVNFIKDWLLGWVSVGSAPLQLQIFLSSLVLFAPPTAALGAISPYLARLNITEVKSSGSKLANINAAGTLGSLVGTFLTGYLLFGFVGTRNLLAALALCLLVTSYLLGRKYLGVVRMALVLIATIQLFMSSSPRLANYITEIDTTYNRVIIRDILYNQESVRVLQTDNQTLQSGAFVDGRTELVFDYAKAFAYAADLVPEAKKILIVGGGAFTLPSFLAAANPETEIDVVEIDNQFVNISERFFNFQASPNLRIIHADGRHFINQASGSYDLIMLDAYSSVIPPFQLLTKEAVGHMDRLLAPGGLVVANLISGAEGQKSRLARAAYTTFKNSFSEVQAFRVSPKYSTTRRQNVMLLAGHKSLDQAEQDRLGMINPEFAEILKTRLAYEVSQGQLLSDDYAPVERLAH